MSNDRIVEKLLSFRERYGAGEGSLGSLLREEVVQLYEEFRRRYPRLAMAFSVSLGSDDLMASHREALVASIVLGRISRGTATDKDRDLLREAVRMSWAEDIRKRVFAVLASSKSDEADQLAKLCDEKAQHAEALLAKKRRRPCVQR